MSTSQMRVALVEFAESVFECLREMDRECPTGLCDYGQFAGLASLQVELGCHAGLRRHLRARGYTVADGEWCYPGTQERCDLHLSCPNGTRVLAEVKNIWCQWFYGRVKISQPKLSELEHDVFTKLPRVRRSDADAVAEIVIGFDGASGSLDRPISIQLKRARAQGWNVDHATSWGDARSDACRIRSWFWWREVMSW